MVRESEEKIHPAYVFAGFSLLILVAYLDNARGPLLPVISKKLAIPYTYAGLFLTVGNLTAIASTMLMVNAMKRYSEKLITVWICGFSGLIALLAPFITDLAGLICLGAIIGVSIATGGAMCNVLTIKGSPAKVRGQMLSGQQVMYGLGSFAAPFSLAAASHISWPWWSVLSSASLMLLVLGVIYYLSLPNERKSHADINKADGFRLKKIHVVALTSFGLYVAGEVMTSMWMATFLVDDIGLSSNEAAPYVSGFFITMAATRLAGFFFIRERVEKAILFICLIVGIVALIVSLLGFYYLLPTVGLVGPFFPLFMAELSRSFPKAWQSMTVLVSVSMQISLSVMNLSVGVLTDVLGIHKAFALAPSLLLISLACLYWYERLKKTDLEAG
jgi:fucose permease